MSDPQLNRDEREVRYPENRLLGVVDSPDQVSRTLDALTSSGFPESDIEIICGASAANTLRANTGRTGLTNVVMRLVESLGMPDDETQIKTQYADLLESGGYLVAVKAATAERKADAVRILKDNGGRSINFFGSLVIEAMDHSTGQDGAQASAR